MADGETIRLRTNAEGPALMSKPKGFRKDAPVPPLDAPLSFEDDDFVAFVHRTRDGNARGYLIPSAEAGKHMRDCMKRAVAAGQASENNRTFVLHFNAPEKSKQPNLGYDKIFAKYALGEIKLEREGSFQSREMAGVDPTAEMERHQREIAELFGVVPAAVSISINLV